MSNNVNMRIPFPLAEQCKSLGINMSAVSRKALVIEVENRIKEQNAGRDAKNITPPQQIAIHKTTLRHLDFLEKILFDELQKQGRVRIIDDTGGDTMT